MPDLNFPSFAGGEIAPAYYGRTDQESYFVSAKSLYNTIASQTGPGIGRGGTVFVATTKSGGTVLLLPFQFNEEQAYVVELGDRYGRIYRNRGQVLEDALNITGISKANPAVVTVNHNLTKGKTIRIASVGGMTQVNNRYFLVDHVLGSSVNISDLDRSSPVRMTLAGGHGFVGGEKVYLENAGGMTEVNNRTFDLVPITSRIVSITGATQANPVVITTPGAHGLVDGDVVLIEDIVGMTQLNNRRFTISPVLSATKNVTAVTKANPGVVTTSANHGFSHGDVVTFASVGGMTQLNGNSYTISRVYAATNTLSSANEGLFFGAGTDPVTVISQSHGYTNGQVVYCTGFGYSVELNGREFTVGNASTDTFDLIGSDSSTVTRPPAGSGSFFLKGGYSDPTGQVNRVDLAKFSIGVDSTGYTTYTSGGTVAKTEAAKFSLDSENGTSHTAYVSGGLASKVIVNDFYLEDENGITHTAYTSGGTVKAVSTTSLKLQTLAGANVDSSAYTTYTSGGTLAAIHEFETPYEDTDLYDADGIPLIQYAQSADFLFLAHPDYPPHQITRQGHADWSCTEFINEEGPFLDENLTDTTIYVETGGVLSVGGVVTLTASDPLWTTDHVGAMWEVRLKDNATSPVWTTATAFTLGAEILSNDLFYRCTDAGTSGSEAPTHDIGEAYDGADTTTSCRWKYIHNGRGIVIITGYTSPTTVTATVISELPAGCVGAANATGRWKEGAWSNAQGFPRAVAIHESRLVWGGTDQEPLAMDFSNTESLFFYNPVELDGTVVRSSAFRRVLDGDNPIRWMKSTEKGLIIGTLGGEWVVATEGVTQGFGPDTAVARQFSANGAAAIQPIRNGDSLLYPQRARRRLRDITFSIDQQKLVTSDRNLRADHIALAGITNTVYAEEPHRVTWNLLGDGTLAGLTYNREPGAQVSAWHKHVIGGEFGDGGNAVVESITVIPGADETTDDLWLVVKRTINGGTVRYVEYMSRPLDYGEDIEDSIFMDSAISYSGSAVTNVTGLDHLEGQTVDVLADGIYYTRTVTNATFSEALPVAASKIHVGLYVWRYIETVYLESAPGDSINTKAQTKRVRAVQIEVIESTKAWCGTGEDDMDQMVFDEFYTGDCPRRYTGFVEETISDDYGRRKFIRIEQREPYPFFVTSITARFEVSNE